MFKVKFYIFLFSLVITSTSSAQWPGQVPPSEVPVYLPSNYDPKTPTPLVIFLHGYAPLTTAWYDILLPLQKDANNYGYIFTKPDGSQDGLGEFYWNATDACCDMWGNEPDHVSYLLALVDSIKSPVNNISIVFFRPRDLETATIGVEQNKPIFTPGVIKTASLDAIARSHVATN